MKKLYLLLFILFLTAKIYPQWVLTNAPKGIPIYSFASSGSNVFAGGDNDSYVDIGGCVFLSTNNGVDWTNVSNGLTCPEICSLAISDTFIFAASYGDGVFLSTNNGNSWNNVSNGLTNKSVYTMIFLSVEGEEPYLFAGTYGGGIFLSTNYGINWTTVNNGLTGLEVYAFAVGDSNLFAGTNDGIFITTDNGKNWKQIAWDNQYVMSLTAYNTNLFTGAFYSPDNGVNWKNVSTGLTDLPVWALASRGSNVFALTNWGSIFLTTNNGENWTLINEGIIDTLVLSIGINDNYIFAGSNEKGVWRRPLSEMITSVENATELPMEFALYQNYPNPFNPSTSIEYRVASTEYVTLKVYDILGREIVTLVNEEKPAGTYEVKWNAEGLSSGIYFYKLQAADFVQTKKMILLK